MISVDHVITGVPWAFRFWLCAQRHSFSKVAPVSEPCVPERSPGSDVVSVGAVLGFGNVGFVPSVSGVVVPVSGLIPVAGVFSIKNSGHHFIETNNDKVLVFYKWLIAILFNIKSCKQRETK